MKIISEKDIKSGQAIYTPSVLSVYDLWVVHFSNYWVWRCPWQTQLQQFQDNITANHLDIGVGTGYYLKRCQWPKPTRLALMDLNPNCLNKAKTLVAELNPETYVADIFKPQPQLAQQFDSISMNFLLHCLPGDMDNKQVVIENAAQMLKPNGILFGATILADPQLHNVMGKTLAAFYNKKGIFSNQNDKLTALQVALERYLTEVDIKVVGGVALFKGKARVNTQF